MPARPGQPRGRRDPRRSSRPRRREGGQVACQVGNSRTSNSQRLSVPWLASRVVPVGPRPLVQRIVPVGLVDRDMVVGEEDLRLDKLVCVGPWRVFRCGRGEEGGALTPRIVPAGPPTLLGMTTTRLRGQCGAVPCSSLVTQSNGVRGWLVGELGGEVRERDQEIGWMRWSLSHWKTGRWEVPPPPFELQGV